VEHTERDQVSYEELVRDQERYNNYYRIAWNVAYLILGARSDCEADIVADRAIDNAMNTLRKRNSSLLETEFEKHLRVQARCRALDRLDSPMHRCWKRCQSLIRRNGDNEEYEEVPMSYSSPGAEEEFFCEGDRELLAQQFAQAIDTLNDLQRHCFVLRFVESMKPREIAKELRISVKTVYEQTRHAKRRVAELLSEWEKKSAEKEGGGLPSE
jgi:RNA polymerase sigma factor (sigma-70 family)